MTFAGSFSGKLLGAILLMCTIALAQTDAARILNLVEVMNDPPLRISNPAHAHGVMRLGLPAEGADRTSGGQDRLIDRLFQFFQHRGGSKRDQIPVLSAYL